MVSGDPTLKIIGQFDTSGAALKAAVDGITPFHPLLSGASLHFVPVAGGNKIMLYQVDVEATG